MIEEQRAAFIGRYYSLITLHAHKTTSESVYCSNQGHLDLR